MNLIEKLTDNNPNFVLDLLHLFARRRTFSGVIGGGLVGVKRPFGSAIWHFGRSLLLFKTHRGLFPGTSGLRGSGFGVATSDGGLLLFRFSVDYVGLYPMERAGNSANGFFYGSIWC